MEQEYLIHLLAEFGKSTVKSAQLSKQEEDEFIPQTYYREVVFRFKFPVIEFNQSEDTSLTVSVFTANNHEVSVLLTDLIIFHFKGEFYTEDVVISKSIYKNHYLERSRAGIIGLFIYIKEDIPFYELDHHIWINELHMNLLYNTAGDEFTIPANEKIHKIISSGIKLQDYSESSH